LCITIAANIADTCILGFDACFPDSVVGFVADGGPTVASYVEYFFRIARAGLETFAPGTAQANINLDVLSRVVIPIAPRGEFDLILNQIEQTLGAIDVSERQTDVARGAVLDLDRSLLAKAFRGELVPQDPNDEPADVMLARVKAAAGDAVPKGRGRPARTAVAPETVDAGEPSAPKKRGRPKKG
jgi:type I restriction enzyme S subunit